MTPERWKQIEQLYHSSLKQDPNQRAAFLKEACDGDDELRREVESLLAFEPRAESFIESPPQEALVDAARELAADPTTPALTGDIGHYQILSRLGEGGMGVVYKARDKNLGRSVAIKVLSAGLVADPEHRKRLVLEARMASALNHPNIVTVHEVSNQDGMDFIVMEYVAGRTLTELIPRQGLPLKEALAYAIQIADGLAVAHAVGIIHRDLKPSNVMVTESGLAKILDFGLAKLSTSAGSQGSGFPTALTSGSEPKTGVGTLLGTVSYMSPEQAEGKPLDARSDIFSFGLVLYEMVTGQRAFQGDSNLAVLTAILRAEPRPVCQNVNDIPNELERIINRCLRKEPKRRWQSMSDVKIALEEVKEELGSEVGTPANRLTLRQEGTPVAEVAAPSQGVPPGQRLRFGWLIAACLTMLIIGILITLAVMKYLAPETSQISPPVVRTPIRLEPGRWLYPTFTSIAISGDGRFVIYSARKEHPGPEDHARLYLRRLDQLEAKPIAGTEGGVSPFLSPDDRWVGFSAAEKLKKVSIEGGVSTILCDKDSWGTSWGQDNSIVFSRDEGLSRVPADGGKEEILTTLDKTKEYSHRLAHWLPKAKGVLFTIMRDEFDLEPRVALLDLKTRKWSVLLEDAADARYVPTGHLVFLRKGTLMAVRFDLEKLRLAGQPVPAVANVMQALNVQTSGLNTATGQYSVSDCGSLVYAMGGIEPDMENTLVWVDQKGNAQPVTSFKTSFWSPRLSPDGQRIAYMTIGTDMAIWIYDINRSAPSRLTSEGKAYFPIWTPDGKRVVFSWSKSGPSNLYWQPADGSQPMERLTTSQYPQFPGSFSPDGATLAFVESHPETAFDVNLLDLNSRRITSFLNSKEDQTLPEFSPDGHWITYSSRESGRFDVYVRSFPGPGAKWQLANEQGGVESLWTRNGKQLFYRIWDNFWAVDIQTDGGFFASKPRLLFKSWGFGSSGPIRGWDISLDSQRFLMVKEGGREPQPVTELVLVQNWFEELKRLAPNGE